MTRLKDKVAVVTGGGQGIGKAISFAFAREGATVVIAGRTIKTLKEACDEMTAKGGKAAFVQTDVSKEDQVKRLMSETIQMFGKLDILVNNSGIAGPTAKVVDMDLTQWNETLAIDLTGSMLCSREALKHMIPRGTGNIINIVSEGGRAGTGKTGYALRSAYCCSKMGQIGLTETMAIEAGEYNIRVNAVSPGPIQGERIFNVAKKRAEATGASFEDILKELASNCSLKRLATEEETAAVVVFLASDESSGVTGQTVPVSCGQHMFV
ncbi:MAG TPA: SDR family NAD(P)-dependent oxidoreductase [Syntrophorhabdaceae bacterium]|nr:SDR family NAD(P)-dependent oxidoreductase [Syntrophorhabdaceae bacterium]